MGCGGTRPYRDFTPPGAASMTPKRFALKTLVACAVAATAFGVLGTAQAQTKLKWAHVYESVRAVPQVVGVGRRRDQEAHQRPLRGPGVPGLQPRQGIRHQPGPDARHRRHHPHRRQLRRPHVTRRWPSRTSRSSSATADHMLKYAKSDVFKELTKGYDEKDAATTSRRSPTTARAMSPRRRRGRSPSPRT